jgi:hypothetical protein
MRFQARRTRDDMVIRARLFCCDKDETVRAEKRALF